MKRFFGLLACSALLMGCETSGTETDGGKVPAQTGADDEILYTSSDGNVVELTSTEGFGANIVSNTYDNGQGRIVFDGAITSVGEYAFFDCGRLAGITIPDSVTSIGFAAFTGCSSLTRFAVPDSVTSIGEGAFGGCTGMERFDGKFASADNRCLIADGKLIAFAPAGLTAYIIPFGVTSVGGGAFTKYRNLASVAIPDSVTSIGASAFSGCGSLASITIPENVTSVGEEAFVDCGSLASVYCKPMTPPALGSDSYCYVFDGVSPSARIYVPTASGWNDYADMIVGYDF